MIVSSAGCCTNEHKCMSDQELCGLCFDPFVSDFQTVYRGVKNPEAVERKRKKQEEIEKQAMSTSVSGGGGLKVSFVFLLILCGRKTTRTVINCSVSFCTQFFF